MGYYGNFKYGEDFYGLGGLPSSVPWDIYDFCEPTDATMLTLFSFPQVTPARTFGPPYLQFDGANDLVMMSDDEADSGFRVDTSVTNQFSMQFSFKPTDLPDDFSDTARSRFYVAAYNRFGKAVGLLFSENGGIATALTGDGAYTELPDSADLFDQGTDYYTCRFTCDPSTGRVNLYLTRQDLVPIIGHQLRYTFDAFNTPSTYTDHTLVEVYGTAANPTQISLDCWRFSSALVDPNHRPIAIPGPDQTLALGGFAGFDGRDSYDPDPGDGISKYWWTVTSAPDGTDLLVAGTGNTPADASGETNRINGAAGAFSQIAIGDLLYIGDVGSIVKYVGSDHVVVIDHVLPANVTGASWSVVKQLAWGGAYGGGVVTNVLEARNTPPGLPSDGDRYLVTATATGLWVGQEDRIATWDDIGGVWTFESPTDDQVIYNLDDTLNRRYVGGNYPAGQWEFSDPLPWELDHWSGRLLSVSSMLPDVAGLHTVELIVRDTGIGGLYPELNSVPTEVLLNVNQTNVPLGVVPDLGWIWNYLPDFWSLVNDKQKIETTWSSVTQILAGLMLELWQHDYGKALLDIQRIFQKRWIHYSTRYEEANYDEIPATIDNSVDVAGFSPSPGSNTYSYEIGTTVLDSLNTPPTVPTIGDAYLVTAVAAGAWVGQEDSVATWNGTAWAFTAPVDYAVIYDLDAGAYLRYTSSAWNAYSFSLGTPTEQHILILDGVGYRIARTTYTSVVVKDELPTSRSQAWSIRPVVVSQFTNFDNERISAGDSLVFEVSTGEGNPVDVEAYCYGAKLGAVCFDDSDVAAYISDPDTTVLFKSVLRRSSMRVNEYIVGVPKLQEVIDPDHVDDPPDPLWESLDYVIDAEAVETIGDVNTLRFQDYYFDGVRNGFDGTISAGPQFFDSPSSDFVSLFGAGADLSGYVLDLPSGRYRLHQVVSATRLELEAEALEAATGLTWTIRRIDDPPEIFWAEVTHVDNRPTIEANFGRLVGFKVEDLETRTDDLDYLSAVRGLWYTYWFGPTPRNLEIGSQILLGLPFAEQRGTIVDIQSPFNSTQDRILIRDADNQSVIRSYFYPTLLGIEDNPETGVAYAIDDEVEQFAPLSKGVEVEDWETDSEWFGTYVGSGDFLEVWKVHTFGILVDAEAFDLTNLEFVMSYILRIKPHYTYPWFVVVKRFQEIIDTEDAYAIGPVYPFNVATNSYIPYPAAWPLFPTPVGWASSPWEKTTRVTTPVYDETERWPTDRYVGPASNQEFGNIHFRDTPGRIPDGWTGAFKEGDGKSHVATRAEGAHIIGDTDESGHCIHLIGQHTLAVNVATDGDMELANVTNWPDIPASGPTTKQKVVAPSPVYAGVRSIEISDPGASKGAYQDFPSVLDRGFQVGVRLQVYVASGQAKFRLRDQDGSTYVAEVRRHTRLGWQEVDLHVWSVADDVNAVRFEMLTGVAGGHFYVDNVEFYTELMPWDQWGLGRWLSGRRGGYSDGGSPEEHLTLQVAMLVP